MPPIKGVKRGPYRKVPQRHRFLDAIGGEGLYGCWLWTMGVNPAGYGIIDQKLAHRVSYEAFIGPIPKGSCVLHNCDNPPCVNPRHLRLGTQTDNMQDVKDRRRFASKLSPEQVIAIRDSGLTPSLLAENFNVCIETVRRIRRKESWFYV